MEFDYRRLCDHLAVKSLPQKISPTGQKCCNLVTCDGNTLFLWNAVESCVEAISVKPVVKDNDLKTSVSVHPNPRPIFDVETLLSNSNGSILALVGSSAVCTVHVPGKWRDWSGRCDALSVNLSRRGLEVRQVKWHPGSPLDNHVIILTADECLRLFDALTGAMLWSSYLCHHYPLAPTLPIPSSRSLGDTPVDFAFATPKLSKDYEETLWPVLVLWGDGDVYLVETKLKETEERIGVSGPLRVFPVAEDNYGTDASSIAILWTTPPLVVLSTCSGTIHHCLYMRGSLLAVERVELELGVVLGDEGNISCPISVLPDPVRKDRYLAVHAAGIHAVLLPLVKLLEEFLENGGEVFPPLDVPSDARYVLCTAITTDSYFSKSPLAGLTHLDDDLYLAVLSDGKVLDLRVPYSPTEVELGLNASRGEDGGLVALIGDILKGAGKPPILKLPGEATNPKEWLELTLAIIGQYRTRVLETYEEAAKVTELRVSQLRKTLESQTEMIQEFLTTRSQLQSAAESIAEHYEEINEKQAELVTRTESLLVRLGGHGGMTARAEKRMREMLNNFSVRTDRLKTEIVRMQSAVEFQNNSQPASSQLSSKEKDIYLGESQKKVIRKTLECLTSEIHTVTRRLKEIKAATNSL